MSLAQEIADGLHLVRQLVAKVQGLEDDLAAERRCRQLYERQIRDQENQLAEKNATLERLQRERAEFWSKLNDPADDARNR